MNFTSRFKLQISACCRRAEVLAFISLNLIVIFNADHAYI